MHGVPGCTPSPRFCERQPQGASQGSSSSSSSSSSNPGHGLSGSGTKPQGDITHIDAVVLGRREVTTPPTNQTKVGVILIINQTQVRQYNSMMP